jgi:hypothetical protein
MSIFALNDDDENNVLVKFSLDENDVVEHIVSDDDFKGKKGKVDERLFKCIVVSNSRILTFRSQSAFIHDVSSLCRLHEVQYNKFLPVEVEQLQKFGITSSFSTTDSSSFIGSFFVQAIEP